MENECEDLVFIMELENWNIISEVLVNEKDEERFLYRLFRLSEFYNKGIELKDVYLKIFINEYVVCGLFDGVKLKYIFCLKICDVINRFVFFIKMVLCF